MTFPPKARPVLRETGGFSLIELLVALTVLAALAAIAIPAFIGQSAKAHDAGTKQTLRGLVEMIEECRLERNSYRSCDEPSELGGAPGIRWGGASPTAGEAGVRAGTRASSYSAYAVSAAKTGNTYHVFIWQKNADYSVLRRCTTDGPPHTDGGCRAARW